MGALFIPGRQQRVARTGLKIIDSPDAEGARNKQPIRFIGPEVVQRAAPTHVECPTFAEIEGTTKHNIDQIIPKTLLEGDVGATDVNHFGIDDAGIRKTCSQLEFPFVEQNFHWRFYYIESNTLVNGLRIRIQIALASLLVVQQFYTQFPTIAQDGTHVHPGM